MSIEERALEALEDAIRTDLRQRSQERVIFIDFRRRTIPSVRLIATNPNVISTPTPRNTLQVVR